MGARKIVVLLPGQGAQHERMAAGLYGWEPVFTDAVDAVFTCLGEKGPALRRDWLAHRPARPLDDDTRAGPLLFAVNYAMGKVVESWCAGPVEYLGHSMGEFVASVLSGVFRLQDAVDLLLARLRLQRGLPGGGMLAAAATPEELRPFLVGDVVVGALNAPRNTVISGPDPMLGEVENRIATAGITCRRLRSRTAYHSPALLPVVTGAEPLIKALPRSAPGRVVHSAYLGRPLTLDDVADAGFWARQPVDPVLFWPTLDAVLRREDRVLLDAGPSQSLAVPARQHQRVRSGRSTVRCLLPARPLGDAADRAALHDAELHVRAHAGPVPRAGAAVSRPAGSPVPRPFGR